MANQLTYLNKFRQVGNTVAKRFSCVLSGSYAQSSGIGTAGETLNFNAAANPGLAERAKLPSVINGSLDALPANTDFDVAPLYGFTFQIERNAVSPTASNFVLRIFASDGTELASGTYASVAAALVATGAQPIVISVRVPLKYD